MNSERVTYDREHKVTFASINDSVSKEFVLGCDLLLQCILHDLDALGHIAQVDLAEAPVLFNTLATGTRRREKHTC